MSQSKSQPAAPELPGSASINGIRVRRPMAQDGHRLHGLVAACPPLDTNSCYCNLLQCSHFAGTSVVAENGNGELVGAISGYRIPDQPNVLFIWQVAVAPSARGLGLAKTMLNVLVSRLAGDGVAHLHTTITKDNAASWALFEAFSRSVKAELREELLFESQQHFGGEHASEYLVRIGPFGAAVGVSDPQSASMSGLASDQTHKPARDSQKNGEAA